MNSLVVTATPTDRIQARRLTRLGWTEGAIILGYVLAAAAMTWRLWASPAQMAPTSYGSTVNMDVYLATWFMRYVATALAHGHLPALVTTAMNAPQGVNAMWNTSLLGPAVFLTPVTLIAGPAVSLAVLLTLGFAGSATTMYIVLRRWQASVAAAALGGALFAFMPALVVSAQDHYHLQFAVLAPLIVDAVLRLVTGRGRPVRTGLWLGALISLQLFTAEELLVDTMIAATVITAILMLSRPRQIVTRLPATLAGLGIAMAVTLVICGRALWVQFHGPLAEHGSPWAVFRYGYPPSSFVTAPAAVLLHGNYPQYLATAGLRPIEAFSYLGWPLQIALILIPFVFWRDLRIRISGLSFLLLEWLTIGGHSVRLVGQQSVAGWLLPWHYLQGLPILNQLIVTRLSILSDGVAAVVLALVADRMITAIRGQRDWRKPALAAGAVAALAAIIVPIIPRPVPASRRASPPAGWTTVISRLHLPPRGAVLVLPISLASPMEFQAVTAEPISITGGYCIAPDPAGKATKCDTWPLQTPQQEIVALTMTLMTEMGAGQSPTQDTMAAAIRRWHPAAVVMTLGSSTALRQYMISFFGPPTAEAGDVLGWRTDAAWYRNLARRQLGSVTPGQ